MSRQSKRRSLRLVTTVAVTTATAILATGCGLTMMGNQQYEYATEETQDFPQDRESGAISPNTLVVDTYNSPIEVRILPQVENIPLSGPHTTTSYVQDPTAAEVFTVRGVNTAGQLIGVMGTDSPQARQVGPTSGVLGILEEDIFTPLQTPGLAQSDQDAYTIGQVATADKAIIWSQAPAGSQQWQVFYQDQSGTQQNLKVPGEPWALMDQSLQLRSPSNGDLVMVGMQKPGDEAAIRYLVQKFGTEHQDFILDGQDTQFLELTTQGLLEVSSNQGAPVVTLRSLFWMSGSFYLEPMRYRESDQIHGVAAAGPVVTISGVNGAESWVDIVNLELSNQVTRVPIAGPASSLQVCGARVGWVSETGTDSTAAYVLDTSSNEVVTLPAPQNAGELYCSADTFAVTNFDVEGTYTGTEVTRFN